MQGALRFLRIYIVPGAVFEAITVGGGYGTGREIVQFFTQYGTTGGLLGLLVATLCMGTVLAVTFEFARRFRAYDYHDVIARLIGPGWVVYEVLAVTMLLLVLAVTGVAAGNILADTFAIPIWVGVALMFTFIVILNFYGREVVIKVLSFWVLLLIIIFVAYFVLASRHYGTVAWSDLDWSDVRPGWFVSGLQYSLYNVAAVPLMLYATRSIETRGQAVISGSLAAVFAMSLGVLFHLSFAAAPAEVLGQTMPTHWMIHGLSEHWLMSAYIIVLFGAMIKTCAGIVQGLNERLDGWSMRRTGRPLTRVSHAALAGVVILVSGGLSNFGLVTLIERGYGTMAWGFLIVFIIPLLTVGLYKLKTARTA